MARSAKKERGVAETEVSTRRHRWVARRGRRRLALCSLRSGEKAAAAESCCSRRALLAKAPESGREAEREAIGFSFFESKIEKNEIGRPENTKQEPSTSLPSRLLLRDDFFSLALLRGRLLGPAEDPTPRSKAPLERRARGARGEAAESFFFEEQHRSRRRRRRCFFPSVGLRPRRRRVAFIPRERGAHTHARGGPAAGEKKEGENREKERRVFFAFRSIAHPFFSTSSSETPNSFQAAAHAKSRSLSLLGVYAANEHLGDSRLKPSARAAAEAVARGNSSSSSRNGEAATSSSSSSSSSPSCCILLVNNGALASFSEGKADAEAGDILSLWLQKSSGGGESKAVAAAAAPGSSSLSSAGGWERASSSSSSSSSALRGAGGEERAKLFLQAVSSGLVDKVHDFDDHLLDLKKDWLNPGLLG